jgi:hypothetical protein
MKASNGIIDIIFVKTTDTLLPPPIKQDRQLMFIPNLPPISKDFFAIKVDSQQCS